MAEKDPVKYFESEIKRLNYYNSQFLKENDFNDEQLYHKQMRRFHNRALHTWGIVEGLEVAPVAGASKVTVAPGIAIDRLGQEIVLPEESDAIGLGNFDAGAKVYVTIKYVDVFDPADKDTKATQTASEYYMRWTERPGVNASATAPAADAPDLVLAIVKLDNDKAIAQVDRSVRRYAGSRIGSSDSGQEFGIYADTTGAWHFFDGGKGADRLTVDSKGNVGIGTDSPGDKLQVGKNCFKFSAGTTYNSLYRSADYGVAYLGFNAVRTDQGWLCEGDGAHQGGSLIYGDIFGKLSFVTVDSSALKPGQTFLPDNEIAARRRMIINESGNVGIGRNSGGAKLDVNGAVWTQALQITDGNGAVYPDNWIGMANNIDGATKWLHIGGITDAGERRLVFAASRIYASGNLGVGTATPGFPLTFANVLGDKISLWGQSGNHYGFGIQGSLLQIHADTAGADIAFGYGSSGAFTELMRVKGNGSVGIGTSDPGNSKLRIASGTDFANFRFDSAGAGELLFVSWTNGWNIDTMTSGKHLYINRDANDNSDVFIGHAGRELTVKGNTGNVGIGTTNPLGPLSIGDSSVVGSDGYIVIGKKNAGGGTRHFRIGFDADFNFTIGDYGSNNNAGTWASPFAMSWNAPSKALYINSAGDVVAGGVYVAGGAMNYRILCGTINGAGGVLAGAGFSVQKLATGLYQINFSPTFSSRPSASVTQIYPDADNFGVGGNTRDNAVITGLNSSAIKIKTGDGNGDWSDRSFTFVVVGPR